MICLRQRACDFFKDRDAGVRLGILVVSSGPMDWLLREHMKPTTTAQFMLDPASSIFGRCQSQIWRLLTSWGDIDSEWQASQWQVLEWVMPGFVTHPKCLRLARCALLQAAAGVFYRFELRYRAWPWQLMRLVTGSESDRAATAQTVLSLPTCCKDSAFTLKVCKLFPTVADMSSTRASDVIASTLGKATMNSSKSERTHASHRRLCDPHANALSSSANLTKHHITRSYCAAYSSAKRAARTEAVSAAALKSFPMAESGTNATAGQTPPVECDALVQPHDPCLLPAGSNVLFMMQNQKIAAAKVLRGHATLSSEEMAQLRSAARLEYDALSEADYAQRFLLFSKLP